MCIMNENKGEAMTFTYDISNLSSGGECGDSDPYQIMGQQVDWIDTGYITNGKQLIVYADGNYFPWGEQQTQKVFGYHVATVNAKDGNNSEILEIREDYKECDLNTNMKYSLNDDQDTKIMYENHFNSYTSLNTNNRNEKRGKKLIDNDIQGDCIIGNNCTIGETNEKQTACVLKYGAGIYMKIGEDTPFSYHIKNYFVPEYKVDCSSGICKYQYKTSNGGETYNLIQVPYAIPPVVYKKGANASGFIWDIRDNAIKNLQIISEYERETNYKFYTLTADTDNTFCTGDDYQMINGICYHSEQKKLTQEEIQNASCPQSSGENINLPNELCNPQSGKRIYIKPADTCYEDDTGEITLTFASGAKAVKSNSVSYRKDGLHVTWIQDFIAVLFEPFFGSQTDKYSVSDILENGYPKQDKSAGTITVCRIGDSNDILYYSTLNGDWIIKTEKYASQGLRIKDLHGTSTTDTMNATYGTQSETSTASNSAMMKKCVILKIKDAYKASKSTSDYTYEETRSTTSTLIRFSNLEDGLFIKIRNAIMSSSVYHIVRIMIVVWFVFSFGVGFVNKQKIFSRVPLITSDWKRFLILLWCTDPKNYEFIDKYLWNALIYGAQAISVGIMDAVSSVYGSSVVAEEPMAFFDEVVSTVTSKETFYKLGAVATSVYFVFFLFLFPMLVSAIIDFILAVIGPIVSLGFTMFSFGNIIMFMPLYALISMFGGKDKNKFTASIKMLVSEFMHFAFSLGFFGMCIGFIYHYFLEVVDMKICWLTKFKINLYLFSIERGDWLICNQGSSNEADYAEKFKIVWNMVTATGVFTMVLTILGKMSITISEMLANIFAKGGGIFGLKPSSDTFNSFKEIFSSVLGKANAKLNEDNNKKHANNMDEKNQDNSDDDGNNEGKNKDKNAVQREGVNNENQQLNERNNNDNINKKNKNEDEQETTDDNMSSKQDNDKNENETKEIKEERDEIDRINEEDNSKKENIETQQKETKQEQMQKEQQKENDADINEDLKPDIPTKSGLQADAINNTTNTKKSLNQQNVKRGDIDVPSKDKTHEKTNDNQMKSKKDENFKDKLTRLVKEQHEEFIKQQQKETKQEQMQKEQQTSQIKNEKQEIPQEIKREGIEEQKEIKREGIEEREEGALMKDALKDAGIADNLQNAGIQESQAGIQENNNMFIKNALLGENQDTNQDIQNTERLIEENQRQQNRLNRQIASSNQQMENLQEVNRRINEEILQTNDESERRRLERAQHKNAITLQAMEQLQQIKKQKINALKQNVWNSHNKKK